MIRDEESFLKKASSHLYQNQGSVDGVLRDTRSKIHDHTPRVPQDWEEPVSSPSQPPSMKKRPVSLFKYIFLGSFGFLVVALMVAGFFFIQGFNTISARNVQLNFSTRTFVDGGEDFPVTVTITNGNRSDLELGVLTVSQIDPLGTSNTDTVIATREIAILQSGKTHQETFTAKLFGEEGSKKELVATINFRVRGSNAIYTSQNTTEIVVRSSPVRIDATIPETVISNQEIPLRFVLSNNGTSILRNTAMKVEYPQGFTVTQTNPSSGLNNQVWYIGDMPIGSTKTIEIKGTLRGDPGELKTIRASVGVQNPRNERELSATYNTINQIIAITQAFLNVTLNVGGSRDAQVPISATGSTTVNVEWENTLDTSMNNVEIRLRLSGSAYDPNRIQANSGFFDTATNTLIWTRQQVPGLSSLAPGQKGGVGFSLAPKSIITEREPTINAIVDIVGFDASGERFSATQVDVKRLVINSDTNLIARSLHTTGPLQNSGPFPPRVGQKTTYTIDWQVTNSRNRLTDTTIKTTLPLWVSWENVVVPTTERDNITYNTVTREVVWTIGEMAPHTTTSKNISFKLGITPTTQHLGGQPPLTGEILLTARDDFTKNNISLNRRALTTQLFNDGTGSGALGQVQQ